MNGIAVHADHAAVNLNFWVTPDDANLDPSSGGLVVYPKAPPADVEVPGDSTRKKVYTYVGSSLFTPGDLLTWSRGKETI